MERESGSFSRRREAEVSRSNANKPFSVPESPDGEEKYSQSFDSMFNMVRNTDVRAIERFIVDHVKYTLGRTEENVDDSGLYRASALSVRNTLIDRFNETHDYFAKRRVKQICYLSMEYLIGRWLTHCLINMGLKGNYAKALRDLGFHLEDIESKEVDAALGNGGLGRLAACFMDSLASLGMPAWGYGMRYTYGMFKQLIQDGYQVECPEYWLTDGNPWEVLRPDIKYTVRFYGNLKVENMDGKETVSWTGGQTVHAVAYDNFVPGYRTRNTNSIRLWSARPGREFDLQKHVKGDYFEAVADRQECENITSVLYPNDNVYSGRVLRLKQQYFFVCATLQDIIARLESMGKTVRDLPDYVAIQLNDTHPTLAIPELMRLLMDVKGMSWEASWKIVTATFNYTNHTILPEALEKWEVDLVSKLLPRHIEIIYEINFRFLRMVKATFGDRPEVIREMSLIEEEPVRMVRMASLAIVGSKFVNGVAEIHSEILKARVFSHFHKLWPEKFQNKTNGVTPRRWLMQANPRMSSLLDSFLKDESWKVDLRLLKRLRKFIGDEFLHSEWHRIKLANKEDLCSMIDQELGIDLDATALFDIHAKRIHEYKRQNLNVFGIIHQYLKLKSMSDEERSDVVKRVVIFAGKAAAGYRMAKKTIKLICAVGEVVNNDPDIDDMLKVVFVPNYCVSKAEVIIPAADVSQHISTAGTEASGTGNMKFVLNGAPLIGTMDGANIEIIREVGRENAYIFGTLAEDVEDVRQRRKTGDKALCNELDQALTTIEDGRFGDPEYFQELVDVIRGDDRMERTFVDSPSY